MPKEKIDYKKKYEFALIIAHIMTLTTWLYVVAVTAILFVAGKPTTFAPYSVLAILNFYVWWSTRKPYKVKKELERSKLLKKGKEE